MKRSEMIKLITDMLPNSDEVLHDRNQLAKEILEKIEEMNMLPPRNEKPYNYYKHNNPCEYIDELQTWDDE